MEAPTELRIIVNSANDSSAATRPLTTKMKRFCVLFLTILTGVSSARASLGDNNDAIEDAYGKMVERHLLDDGRVSILYEKDRYLLFVLFANHRSVLERYSRIDGAELSKKEISRFLKANAGGPTWIPDKESDERRFERSDHKAEAIYGKFDERPTLTVRAIPKTERLKH